MNEEEIININKRLNTLDLKVFILTLLVAFLMAFVIGMLSTRWF